MKRCKISIVMMVVFVLSLLFACSSDNIDDGLGDYDWAEYGFDDSYEYNFDDGYNGGLSDDFEEDSPDVADDNLDVSDDDNQAEAVDPVDAKIAEMIDSMTIYEKVYQMIVVVLDSITGVSGTTIVGDITRAALERHPVGGVIHFAPNITSADQITLLNSGLQDISAIPLFIAVDEEGGRVARLRHALRAHSVGAMLTYETHGPEKAFENAVILSDALKLFGFNTNFAPVADVWSNPSNTVIGNRAFSRDFNSAAELVAAAVRGFNESGIICSLKHFPGHGDTREDSHHRSAYINKTLDELREEEFIPFTAGIAAGADMVMTGHLIVPEVDELPATLSEFLITDILRNELGFNGVVITDSLAMNAVSRNFSVEYVAVTAINAGVDIILMPVNAEETVSAVISAVETGEISIERINESVSRILRLKITSGLIEIPVESER